MSAPTRSRRARRWLVVAGIAGVVALWRDRTISAHERAEGDRPGRTERA